MSRPLYVLCFLLLSLPLRGQTKLALSATVAPTYERTTYGPFYLYPDSDGQVVEPIPMMGRRGAAGVSAGATLHYTYAPGWSVAAGLWYQQLRTRQARPAGDGTTTIRNRAVRVPLLLNYRLTTRRLSPYLSLGTVLDFPVASRVVVTRGSEPTQRLRLGADAGPVFHALLGAGAAYQFNRRYTLIVQPVGTYKLGRFGGFDTYAPAYALSLLTQVVYQF